MFVNSFADALKGMPVQMLVYTPYDMWEACLIVWNLLPSNLSKSLLAQVLKYGSQYAFKYSWLRLLQTFTGVFQKKIHKRTVFKETPQTTFVYIERKVIKCRIR